MPSVQQGSHQLMISNYWYYTTYRPFDRRSNDYITAFHVAGRPPVKDSQPCQGQWAVQLIECMPTSDVTDSLMFGLAPMLPISNVDVQIGLTLFLWHAYIWCLCWGQFLWVTWFTDRPEILRPQRGRHAKSANMNFKLHPPKYLVPLLNLVNFLFLVYLRENHSQIALCCTRFTDQPNSLKFSHIWWEVMP